MEMSLCEVCISISLCMHVKQHLVDRMLVRVYHTEQKAFKKAFDEQECRITRGLDHEEWAEFLLIWREQRLELYEDYVCVYTLSISQWF